MRKVHGDLVLVASKFAGDQYLEHFSPTLSETWEKYLVEGEPAFHAERTACYQLQQQTKVHVLRSFSAANYARTQ